MGAGVPLVTGATAGQAAGDLNQAMPTTLSTPARGTGPYLPPADIGRMSGSGATSVPLTTAAIGSPSAATVSSQPLPPLPPSGSIKTMPAQTSVQPVQVANAAQNSTAGQSSPSRVAVAQSSPQLNVVPDNAYVHRIQSGESLYSIARQYNVSTNELVSANNLVSADKIFVGQSLIIPGRVAAPQTEVLKAPTAKTEMVASADAADSAVAPASRIDRGTTAAISTSQKPVRTETAAPAPKSTEPAKPTQTASLNTEPSTPSLARQSGGMFSWPVNGSVIVDFASSKSGINIAAKEGTAVRAVDAGTVIYVGSAVEGYGNLVLIKHPNGYVSAYAHLKDATIAKGDTVSKGQTIGSVGMTGSVSRPQLHFELRQGATPVDPMPLMAG